MNDSAQCPCGSEQPLTQCCAQYIAGDELAPTAEALMRSRYTAYCQGNVEYLIATHHPSQRKFSDRNALTKSVKRSTWLGLTVLNTVQGQPEDNEGVVEFMAIYRASDVQQLHERSRFKKRKGRWFYLNGEHLPPVEPKRNEPCWCGSGKKFKQCHGKGAK
ncbi:MAG: YchJ family protein [Cyanobacteria bacterium P01_H01_bin.58]